jgi:hypothetical protein
MTSPHGDRLVKKAGGNHGGAVDPERRKAMAKDHGPSVKDDKQYEGLRKKGMSKQRAARIANDPDSSKKGGKKSSNKSGKKSS